MNEPRSPDRAPALAVGRPPDGTTTTLEERLRGAARHGGSAPAFRDRSEVRATHDDVRRIRDGVRCWLRNEGVARSDRVVLILPSDWQLAAFLLGVMSAAEAATLDPTLTDRELAAYLSLLRPCVVLTDVQNAPRISRLVGETTRVLSCAIDQADGPADDELPAADDTALLLFTSGTTAVPKVVRLTQGNLVAAVDSIAGTLRLGPADRALNAMSLHHGHGIFPGTLAPLTSGGCTACVRLGSADDLLAVVRSAAPTWYSAAPVVHHSVFAMVRGDPRIAEMLRLRVVRSTSSALSPDLLVRLEQALGAPVVEAYALSEAPGQIASNPLDGPRKAGTVGVAQGTEIVLMTSSGEVTNAPGSTGEVLVRGPNVMPGYLGVPDGEQPFVDGWLRTGDHATIDEDGYLCLWGRVSEIISRGSEKFVPAEVEAVLAEHPAVGEVAVYGRAHVTLGEEAAAAVVLREGQAVSELDLIAFAAERLASYKVPVTVHFMAEIPRTRAGKVLRRRLEELTAGSATVTQRTASAR